jgi:hypothetical protein
MCLDQPGRAVIDHIDLVDVSGGLRIDAFTVMPVAVARERQDLAVPGLSGRPVVVDQPCPELVALILQYSKTSDETGSSRGIVVHYTSGGTPYSVAVPVQVVLCASTDVTTWGCQPG